MYSTQLGERDTPNFSNVIWGFCVTVGCVNGSCPQILCNASHREVESNSPPFEYGLALVTQFSRMM